MSIEITCPECAGDTLLRREPEYDGFTKTRDRLFCASCGHEFPDETSVPFKKDHKPAIFTEDDKPDTVNVFQDDERNRNCRHCRHYVMNPFMQRCDRHKKWVEATDDCDEFELREQEEDSDDAFDKLVSIKPEPPQ